MRRCALALALLSTAACTAPQPCPSPLQECEGECVALDSDRRHCGACEVGCPVGQVCSSGACTAESLDACPERTAGAFVTLGHCGTAVKLWIGADAFVDQAISRVGAAPDPAFVPSLAVLASADCDAQWSWHVDPASASTAASADAGCNRCPAEIEPLVRGGPPTTRRWCPADAAVLAVDDRRAAP